MVGSDGDVTAFRVRGGEAAEGGRAAALQGGPGGDAAVAHGTGMWAQAGDSSCPFTGASIITLMTSYNRYPQKLHWSTPKQNNYDV